MSSIFSWPARAPHVPKEQKNSWPEEGEKFSQGWNFTRVYAHTLLGNRAFLAGISSKWGHPQFQAVYFQISTITAKIYSGLTGNATKRHRNQPNVKKCSSSGQTSVLRGTADPPNLNQNSYFHSSYILASKQKRGGMGPRTLAIEEIILINKI